jgi:putative polyhydroxyalkanoate system protein
VPDIHLEREHKLGLTKARKIAMQWAELAEEKFGMECTVLEGKTSDTIEFTRSGVKGELLVEANRFTVDAKLGFLIGAFSRTIESEIEKNLDGLLNTANADANPKPGAKATAKPAIAKAPATTAAKPAAKPAVKKPLGPKK